MPRNAPAPVRIPLRATPTGAAELRVQVVGDQLLLEVREHFRDDPEGLPHIIQVPLSLDVIPALIVALEQVRR
jgi:hypothetical protein